MAGLGASGIVLCLGDHLVIPWVTDQTVWTSQCLRISYMLGQPGELPLVWLTGWGFICSLLESFLNKEPNDSWIALKWEHGLSAVFKAPFGLALKVRCNNCPIIDIGNNDRHLYGSASSINAQWTCWRQELDLISLLGYLVGTKGYKSAQYKCWLEVT